MMTKIFILLLIVCSYGVNGYMVNGNPNRRLHILDPDGRYQLEWTVDRQKSRIYFNVTVKTLGWILFGLANNAEEETGKDVIVGGVMGRNGTVYFSDRHEEGKDNILGVVDISQDYKLEQSWESKTETFLSFSRNLVTCDPEDYPITENKVTLIWAYGKIDDYDISRGQNYQQRGSFDLYLLDIDYTPKIIRDRTGNPTVVGSSIVPKENDLQLWTIASTVIMPGAHTSYLCSFHKGPRVTRKHHVIGIDYYFPDGPSKEHPHHITVYKCNAPSGYNARKLFEPFVNAPPESCFFLGKPPKNSSGMPIHFCTEVHNGWVIGERSVFFPPEVGFPVGEHPDEYYMMQVHYDNPQQKQGVEVTVRLESWFTSQIRANDGGLIGMGVALIGLPPTIVVPPQTKSHQVWGHCSGECTERMFPAEGINVFSVLLHSHHSGKAMRFRHFDVKRNVELPWIVYDDNYNNRFQQSRMVRHGGRRVFPGDQLTLECTYDNTWTNSSVISGFSTKHEMCSAFVFYYGKVRDYSQCRSEIVDLEGRRRFLGGLENITWVDSEIDWVATSPRNLAGLTVTAISNQQKWSKRQREELQIYQKTTPLVSGISRDLFLRSEDSVRQALEVRGQLPIVNPPTEVNTEDDFSGLVGYPFHAKPYFPPQLVEKLCTGTG